MNSISSKLKGTLYSSGQWINEFRYSRLILIALTIVFSVVSLVFSNRLVRQMATEEQRKLQIWAHTTQAMVTDDYSQILALMTEVLSSNESIPVILTNEEGHILSYSNLDVPDRDREQYLYGKLSEFRSVYPPIIIETQPVQYLYYGDSKLQQRLLIYPYIQLGVFLFILLVSVLALVGLKRADQNRIWAGLSRETAHQLGTPISSLIAWRELLEVSGTDPMIISEMGKDIERLELIADRFQKVGSSPQLEVHALSDLVAKGVGYMQSRVSKQVALSWESTEESPVYVMSSPPLIAWVLENLIKNAVDAMQGKGSIEIRCGLKGGNAYIDVRDTGRGIPKSKAETIFRPGYTTRLRGWGLGLSLARRIVEEYHKGRIFVHRSEVGKGTTFRILLPTTTPPSLDLEA